MNTIHSPKNNNTNSTASSTSMPRINHNIIRTNNNVLTTNSNLGCATFFLAATVVLSTLWLSSKLSKLQDSLDKNSIELKEFRDDYLKSQESIVRETNQEQ